MKVSIEGQPLELAAREPPLQARPNDLLPVLYEVVAAISDSVVQTSADEGRPVQCRAGCGACCRQLVPLGPSEAQRVRALVDAMPAERQREVRARFADAVARLNAAGVSRAGVSSERSEGLDHRTDPEDWLRLSLDYFAARVPCPFLVDESCSIHPERPLVCREHLVTSDPARCAEPKMNRVTSVGLTGRFFAALEQIDRVPALPSSGSRWRMRSIGRRAARCLPPGRELLERLLALMPFDVSAKA